jgi:hypothetical protein
MILQVQAHAAEERALRSRAVTHRMKTCWLRSDDEGPHEHVMRALDRPPFITPFDKQFHEFDWKLALQPALWSSRL